MLWDIHLIISTYCAKDMPKKLSKWIQHPLYLELEILWWIKKYVFHGLNSGENIEKAYNNIALKKGIKKIGDIQKMPLVIPAVDVMTSKEFVFTNQIPEGVTNKSQYITEISIGKAVRASSSFPAVFCPCDYKEHKFLDGGILDNIPVLEVKKQGADKVIAINFKADDIMGNKISEESLEQSDFVLTISTDKTGLLDVEKLDKCYQYGYQAVVQNWNKINHIIMT